MKFRNPDSGEVVDSESAGPALTAAMAANGWPAVAGDEPTVDDLKGVAKELGVTGYSRMNAPTWRPPSTRHAPR